MDLTKYRASDSEQQRMNDLLRLMPKNGEVGLDIGARDGYFARLMVGRFQEIVAFDLSKPDISHPRIRCIEGNAVEMNFQDKTFDFVLCAEVLEHVPTKDLARVCREIERVSSDQILIGVPYKQDIRVGRTTCLSCKSYNPPWGHVNTFDENILSSLFANCTVESTSYVGSSNARTNRLSAALMDFAGNPFGTYDQEEPCVNCQTRLLPPPRRHLAQKVATKLAFWSRSVTSRFATPHANWIHVVFRKAY